MLLLLSAIRMAILKHIRAIEQEAAFCVDVLQGVVQQPSPEKWSAAKQRCQELQKQWHSQGIPAAAQLSVEVSIFTADLPGRARNTPTLHLGLL